MFVFGFGVWPSTGEGRIELGGIIELSFGFLIEGTLGSYGLMTPGYSC